MTGKPLAGTYRLDGMLQGPLPPDGPVAAEMEAWIASAKRSGLAFHLSIDGGNFSIVADPTVQRTARLVGGGLDELLEDALNSLLEILPEAARPSAFSTIRSEEFRSGSAAQTLYAVGPDGRIAAEQRVVDSDTAEPPPELTAASLRRAFFPAVIALLLVLLVSSFFIDYRKLFGDARDRIVPLSKDEVVLSQDALGEIVEVELKEVDNKRSALVFVLRRGSAWETALASSPAEVADDWSALLLHAAIHQRRLRVELFNKEGKLLSHGEIRLDQLHEKEEAEVAVVARLRDRLARVVVRP